MANDSFATSVTAQAPASAPPASPDLSDLYNSAAREWGIDPVWLRSIAQQESGQNPNAAQGGSGEKGMMQFMPGTAAQVGVADPTVPAQAVYGAAKLLRSYLDRYGNPQLATAAYNAGQGAVDKFVAGQAPLPTSTVGTYLPAVAANYQRYSKAGQASQPGFAATTTADAPASPPTAGPGGAPLLRRPNGDAGMPGAPDRSTSPVPGQAPSMPGAPALPAGQQAAAPTGGLGALSDDDFLKQTTAPAPHSDDDATFLAHTGAMVPQPQSSAPAPAAPQADMAFPTVAPHLAPDGSGAMTNLSDADFAKFKAGAKNATGPSQPPVAKPPPDQPITGIPSIDNAIYGLVDGGRSVVQSGVNLGNYVDSKVPFLAALDRANPLIGDGEKLAANLEAQHQATEAGAGQTAAGKNARLLGQIATTGPLMGVAGRALGAGANLLAQGARYVLPETSAVVGNVGNSLMGNALTRGAVNYVAAPIAEGAGAGGGFGALTSGGDNQSLSDSIQNNALAGAVLGPAARVIVGGAGGAYDGIAAAIAGLRAKYAPGPVLTAEINKIMAASKSAGAPAAPSGPQEPTFGPQNALMPTPPPGGVPGRVEPVIVQPSGPPAPSPTTVVPPYGSRVPSTNPLAAGAPPAPEPIAAPPPAPARGAPAPAGAAATSQADLAANAMTPAQAQASRLTGFQQQLQRKANTTYDDTVYVPGVNPTAAEIAADPELAAKQRVIAQGNPKFTKLDADNNEHRVDFYNDMAKTPTITETLKEARSIQAESDLNAAFGAKKPVDAQPVVDQIQSILTTPRNSENTALQKYVQPLLDRLRNADGSLKTDPEQLYGLREDVARMMSKPSQAADSNLAHVTGELGDIKSALDTAIESGAPGYKKYLENFATASRPIDEQELLQSLAPTVINKTTGNITLSGISNALNSIVGQMGRRGLNPAKSVSDETMQSLFDLRQDLLRQNNRMLGVAPGSATHQNFSVGADLANAAGHTLAHGVAHAVAGPAGNMLLGSILDNAATKAGSRSREALENLLLNPPRQ